MRRAALAVAGLGVALTAGCGSSSSGSQAVAPAGTPTSAAPTPTAVTTSGPARSGACAAATPRAGTPQQFGKEPPLTIARAAYTASITTNCGAITLSLDGAKAPHTVNSFAFLAGKHFFDGTPCHRLTTEGIFVLQCGDPTGSGTGGPGYTIPDENLRGATYPAGTVAMANTGQPHTGGSQFFLVYADTQLPPQYTPFGHVTTGLAVLRAIAADGSNPPGDGAPVDPVVIKTFTVTKA